MPVEAPDQWLDTDSNNIEANTDHLGVWFICDNTRWAPMPNSNTKKAEFIGVATMGMRSMATSGMQTEDVQSEDQGSDPLTFNIGDKINIRAQVHNEFSDDITDDVLVSFYAGDPDAGGVNIGNATIAGGIPFNTSKTAVLNDYTITSDSTDIYVKIDPLNRIPESDESNNKAYQVLSTGSQDSDGDGIPDIEEIGGMYDMRSHSLIYTDPFTNDTDADGLNDSAEMGPRLHDDYGNVFYEVNSYPDYGHADSDGDGLTDYEELKEQHTIRIVDTHDDAVNLYNALHNGSDYSQYLHTIPVTSDALNPDTDGDSINDSAELKMGTNPRNNDTDNDGIQDSLENSGEDPTIFDVTGPQIDVRNINVYKIEGTLFKAEYDITLNVYDAGGLDDVTVVKDGVTQHTWEFTDRPNAFGGSTTFYTDWTDTIFDEFEATRVDVNALDSNNNPATKLAYHRPSMWGQLAVALTGSSDIYSDTVALSLGMMSGYTDALAQYPELAAQLKTDPVGTIGTLGAFAAAARGDPALLSELVATLPSSTDQMMTAENPYDKNSQNGLYGSFESGWYSGYIIMTLLTIWAGAEAFKAVQSSSALTNVITSITTKYGSIAPFLYVMAALCVTGEISLCLEEEAATYGIVESEAKTVIAQETTSAKRIQAIEYWERITPEERTTMNGHLDEVDQILKDHTPTEAASLTADPTFQNIMSLNNLQGVPDEYMIKLRANLIEEYHKGTISQTQANNYITIFQELGARNNVLGLDNIVKKMSDANSESNFYGIGNEAETGLDYAKISGNTVKFTPNDDSLEARYDLEVTSSDGTIRNIECKKVIPTGVLNNIKIKNYMGSAQDKFADSTFNPSETVCEINGKEGTIDIDVNDIDNLLSNTNTAMNDLIKDPKYPNSNRIGKLKIVLNDRTIIFVKDGNGFRLPEPGDVVI